MLVFRRTLLFILIFFIPFLASSQETEVSADSLKELKIATYRKAAIGAFQTAQDELLGASLDSLLQLEDSLYTTTVWDERWLLYIHLGRYESLFEEIDSYTMDQRLTDLWKIQPPEDSLFVVLDNHLYENRVRYADIIRKSGLKEEERLFTLLFLDYLLRIDQMEEESKQQELKIERFAGRYPNSRFKGFINQFMYHGSLPQPWAVNFDMGILYGSFSDQLERNLSPYFAFNTGLAFWYKGLNAGLRFNAGGMHLERDIIENFEVWPKDDKVTMIEFGLELGYDVVDKPRLRMFPSIGAGWTWMRPPMPDEGADPLPAYYGNFYFNSPNLTAALTTDLKFKFSDEDTINESGLNYGYPGVRLRIGYERLFLGQKNVGLAGDMLFFAVNFNLYGRDGVRRKL
ncbi:MAG: hypothetical protein R2792_10980 [Saprospiraceae bacterium]